MYAWTGKILRVNLTDGSWRHEDLDPLLAEDYLGARGLGTRLFCSEVDPGVDPLGPENKLLMIAGALTGTGTPSSGRYNVVTKSPLTGTIAASNSGGYFPAELKYAGIDGIIFEGQAPEPVYLWVNDAEVELRPAAELWGKTVTETTDALLLETHPEAKVACIGPAGEKQVLYAAVLNDYHRAAGRSGVGAVMGSKKLKAVVVRGTGGVRVADLPAFTQAAQDAVQILRASEVTGVGMPALGTPMLVNVINSIGALPTRNHQAAVFEGAEQTSGEALAATYLTRKKACFGCVVACGRATKVPAGPYAGVGEGPEYEAAWSLGADCGISDLAAIVKANYYANDLGYDPISFGVTLACAMEMFERGYLPEADTDLALRFGDAAAMVEAARKAGYREGVGDLLALGAYRLAEKYGHPELAMTSKKQEYPAYDPRAIQGIGLNYATSNRGGCHVRGYTVAAEVVGVPQPMDPHAREGKAAITKMFQDLTAMVDSTGLCLFVTFALTPENIAPILTAATGKDYSAEDLLQAGERIWNLERLFNNRAGFGRRDDTLAPRLLEEPLPEGPAKGLVSQVPEMLDEYYRIRGWDSEGRPSAETLARLGLEE